VDRNDTGTYSIEELSGEQWKHSDNFPSSLVKNCYEYRKMPINKLEVGHIRLLISQGIGLTYVMPIALKQLKIDSIIEGSYYPGDVLSAVGNVDAEYWQKNLGQLKELIGIIIKHRDTISSQLPEKKLVSMLAKLEDIVANV